MFQMELMRRNASGRLSELAGPVTLPLDRTMRMLGLRQAAEADYAALPADTRAVLQAYANGVNAWIDAARPLRRAGVPRCSARPEPWTPVDSLLWGKTMGLWLSLNWRTELSRQALAGQVPQQLIDELWPDQSGPGRPEAALSLPRQFADAAARLAAVLPRFPGAVHPAEHRVQRMGGGRTPLRHRRAAAGRRPASGVRLSRRSGTWRASTRRA